MGEEIVGAMMRASLEAVGKQLMGQLKAELAKSSLESIRRYLLAEVASQFSKEVAYNTAQYVRALGSSSIEIEYDGNPGEVLEQKFKKSVDKFERWIEQQPPDSPVVKRLLETYGVSNKGTASYIKRTPQSVWQTLKVTPRKEPWLNRTSQPQDISDMLSSYAAKIFDEVFGNSPLSTTTIAPNNV